MRKAMILYDSVYGNTKKIAMSLSRGLEAGGLYVDSSPIKDFDSGEIKNYDIIGVGGPTHFHGASKQMKLFLKRIRHLKMENKYGFAFETKADFRLAGSAAKRIRRNLKKMKLNIIYPTITGIVLDKEGPLQENTLYMMEKVGLDISNKIINSKFQKLIKQGIKNSKNSTFNLHLNRLVWILLAGGPIFFLIRAIQLASTGGDTFATINLIFSWFLLLLEIGLAGIAGSAGIIGLISWIKVKNRPKLQKKLYLRKIILILGVMTYIVQFIRVAIWLSLFVI